MRFAPSRLRFRQLTTSAALALILLAPAGPAALRAEAGSRELLQWDAEALPPLPNPLGVAGPFTGVSHGALVVAGGANFPDSPPWEGGEKVWHARGYVLPEPSAAWITIEQALPRPLAYGATVSYGDALLCVGGCDALECAAEVFVLRYDRGSRRLSVGDRIEPGGAGHPLPPLPAPLAFHAAALLGDTLYVLGGQHDMQFQTPTRSAWRLNLAKRFSPDRAAFQWEPLPWPAQAAPRILPLAAVQRDGEEPCLFLMSGRNAPPGGPAELLTDAWKLRPSRLTSRPGEAWTRLADSPRCLMAGSAAPLASNQLLAIGGDDGRYFRDDLRDRHPEFPRDQFFSYHPITDTWRNLGSLPANQVTTAAVWWRDAAGKPALVIPSGEIRPGVRTPNVLLARPQASRAPFRPLDYAALCAYLASLVGIGWWCTRRTGTTEDFFLGGRRIPWWAAGISIFGTQLSAITFMAIPAKSYAANWQLFLGNMMIVLLAPVIRYVFLPTFRRYPLTTAYEYLEIRFNRTVRLLGAGAFLLLQFGRMGVVMFLPAAALSAVTGFDLRLCIVIMGVLATFYTVLGGIEAVVWTDVLQAVVLLGGAGLALYTMLTLGGGAAQDQWEQAYARGKLQWAEWSLDPAAAVVWVVVLGHFLQNLVPYTADQTVVQRYFTTRDESRAAQALWTNALLTIPASLLFFGLGTALWMFYRAHPERLAALDRPDEILPWFIASEMLPGFAGLVIAALFAAAMSSLDSSLNSMATVILTDGILPRRPIESQVTRLRLARGLTLLLGVLGTGSALLMAALPVQGMFDRYLEIIGLFGAGLAGLFCAGMLTRRITSAGAILGFFASAAVLALVKTTTSLHFLLYAPIGLAVSLGVAGVASLFQAPPSPTGCAPPAGEAGSPGA